MMMLFVTYFLVTGCNELFIAGCDLPCAVCPLCSKWKVCSPTCKCTDQAHLFFEASLYTVNMFWFAVWAQVAVTLESQG